MEGPDYVILTTPSPKFGGQVIAFSWWSDNNPSISVWRVECNSVDCDYEYPDEFKTLEDLAKKFEAVD